MTENITLAEVRPRTCDLVKEWYDLEWKNIVGLINTFDLEAHFQKYHDILQSDVIKTLALQPGLDPEESRRLTTLVAMLTSYHIESAMSPASRDIAIREMETEIEYRNRTISFRALGPTLRNEPDRQARQDLLDLQQEVITTKLLELKQTKHRALIKATKNLGYESYLESCEKLQGRDFFQFDHLLDELLAQTDQLYHTYLQKFCQQILQEEASALTLPDMTYILRGTSFDVFFTKEKLVPTVFNTFEGLGFKLSGHPHIHLDLEARPKKMPRPCIVAVDPPFDVRLSVYPSGGPDDYASFLHESGHAQHFAHVIPDLDFEYKYHGDRGFTEGIAYLFQRLVTNQDWLQTYITMPDYGDYLKFNAFSRLWAIRRLTGKFKYELTLHAASTLEGMSEKFQHFMKTCTLIDFPATYYLDFDTELYVAGYIRATLFEAQLRQYLQTLYGTDWWRKQKAGEFLTDLFQYGRKQSAEEILAQLGCGSLSYQAFIEDIRSILT